MRKASFLVLALMMIGVEIVDFRNIKAVAFFFIILISLAILFHSLFSFKAKKTIIRVSLTRSECAAIVSSLGKYERCGFINHPHLIIEGNQVRLGGRFCEHFAERHRTLTPRSALILLGDRRRELQRAKQDLKLVAEASQTLESLAQ